MKLIIYGNPVTKKNSMKIVKFGNRPGLIQSDKYRQYESDFITQVSHKDKQCLSGPLNVKSIYYMETKRRVDLTNLMAATHDCLVKAEVIEDDNHKIIVSVDGSRVEYDKHRPRVEITINEVQ